MSYKEQKLQWKHRDWATSVDRVQSRLNRWQNYMDKNDPAYVKLIEMLEHSIFYEVDRFPVHFKSLPESLKEKYNDQKKLDNSETLM